MTLLSVENLSLSIHDTPILRDVSFQMREGEVFGLVGESGSGKSLTAFSLMQLLPNGARLSGRAVLNGTDLLALSESHMCAVRGRDVGMIFEEPMTALNPVQCIGDQVAEALVVHGAASRADAARDELKSAEEDVGHRHQRGILGSPGNSARVIFLRGTSIPNAPVSGRNVSTTAPSSALAPSTK